jgi:hypothetical protein
VRTVSARVSPPKLGGVAAALRKWCASHLSAADGVVPKPKRFKDAFLKRFGSGTTPSAPLMMLRDISLVAATPPNLGGDTLADSQIHQRLCSRQLFENADAVGKAIPLRLR